MYPGALSYIEVASVNKGEGHSRTMYENSI